MFLVVWAEFCSSRIIQYKSCYKWQNDTIIKIVDVRYNMLFEYLARVFGHYYWTWKLPLIKSNQFTVKKILLLHTQQIINKMIRRHNVHNKELYDLDTDTGPCLPSQWRNWGNASLTFLDLGPEPCCHCQDNPAGGHILPDPDMSVIVDNI